MSDCATDGAGKSEPGVERNSAQFLWLIRGCFLDQAVYLGRTNTPWRSRRSHAKWDLWRRIKERE